MKHALVLAAAALLASACVPEEGPLMNPGDDCIACHGGGQGEGEPAWTVAGTVFPSGQAAKSDGLEGARITIVDADGKTFTLRSNQAGNFYTRERVTFPIDAIVEKDGVSNRMVQAPQGSCNFCHTIPSPTVGPQPAFRVTPFDRGTTAP